MTLSQTVVLTWCQFVLASTFLLFLARLALSRLSQPSDRLRAIELSLSAVVVLPLLMTIAPWPSLRLGLVRAIQNDQTLEWPAETRNPIVEFSRIPVSNANRAEPEFAEVLTDASSRGDRGGVDHAATGASADSTLQVQPANSQSDPPVPRSWSFWQIVAALIVMTHGAAIVYTLLELGMGAALLCRLVCTSKKPSATVDRMWDVVTRGGAPSVRLRVSASIDSPMMFGCVRPVILVPQHIAKTSGDALLFCLAHEWAHIQRRDMIVWRCVWACQSLLFFQPMYWSLRKELRLCQDMLADAHSTRAGADAVEYAALLVRFAQNRISAPLNGSLTFLDETTHLTRRVQLLLQNPFLLRLECSRIFSVATAAVAVFFALLIGAVRLDGKPVRTVSGDPSFVMAKDESAPSISTSDRDLQTVDVVDRVASSDSSSHAVDAPNITEVPSLPANVAQQSGLQYVCRVVDMESGKGIADARVSVSRGLNGVKSPVSFKTTQDVTDADGNFRLDIPAVQAAHRSLGITMTVKHDDYVDSAATYSLESTREDEKAGRRPGFELVKLRPGGLVTGLVRSPDGRPLDAVSVVGDAGLSEITQTVTDRDGRFRLNLPKAGSARVQVSSAELGVVEKEYGQQRGDIGEIRFPAGISGNCRVVDAQGKPVARAMVAILQTHQRGLVPSTTLVRTSQSDAEGRFTWNGLADGEYLFQTAARPPGTEVFLATHLTIKNPREPISFDIQAVPSVEFQSRVVDSAGNCVRNDALIVSGKISGDRFRVSGQPDSDGVVSLRVPRGLQFSKVSLQNDPYGAVRFRSAEGQPLQSNRGDNFVDLGTIDSDLKGFVIVRYAPSVALISAVDEAQNPIKDYLVTAEHIGQANAGNVSVKATAPAIREKDGRFRVLNLRPDEEIRLNVYADGFSQATQTFKLTEGETKEFTVTLKKLD